MRSVRETVVTIFTFSARRRFYNDCFPFKILLLPLPLSDSYRRENNNDGYNCKHKKAQETDNSFLVSSVLTKDTGVPICQSSLFISVIFLNKLCMSRYNMNANRHICFFDISYYFI